MKRTIRTIALVALTMAMAACSDSDEPMQPDQPAEKPEIISNEIHIAPEILTSESRVELNAANKEVFSEGDQVYMVMWTDPAVVFPQNAAELGGETILQKNLKEWTPSPVLQWVDNVSTHYFYGIYPAHWGQMLPTPTPGQPAEPVSAAQTRLPQNGALVLDVDPVNPDYDILVGAVASKPVSDLIPITFRHLMARLEVKVNLTEGWTAQDRVEKVAAAAHYAVRVVFDATAKPELATMVYEDKPQAKKQLSEKIVGGNAPQTFVGMLPFAQPDFRKVGILVNGRTFVYESPAPIELKSGFVTTLNLNLKGNELLLDNFNLTPWVDGGEADLDLGDGNNAL